MLPITPKTISIKAIINNVFINFSSAVN
jgi:hypothetical protein